MASRLYTAVFSAVATTAAQDLFELLGVAEKSIRLHRLKVFQTSDVKDAEEEILPVTLKRGVGSVTSGSGGSTPTAQPLSPAEGAFGGAVECNNTTQMAVGSGTIATIDQIGWNVRIPLDHVWTPEDRPVINGASRFAVSIPAPADSLTCYGLLTFEVID